ncbi:MAG: hypothetical protein CO138_00225 [Candidatus Moranbacteria bacterium CG_4_9_14_3_um_filter_33_15]|nr:MAG: hypothetical protein CO138_00225 [Candidatus Moranbacteria bacterium CG_4_9_14_3_um_filter_33_15]
MGKFSDFAKKIKQHIVQHYFFVGSGKLVEPTSKNKKNKLKEKFKLVAVFSDGKKRYLLRTNNFFRQAKLIDIDNKRSVKKLLWGKSKKEFPSMKYWKNVRFFKINSKEYYLSYQTVSQKKKTFNLLFSTDLRVWRKNKVDQKNKEVFIVYGGLKKSKYLIFKGEKFIKAIISESLTEIKQNFSVILKSREGHFDEKSIVPAVAMKHNEGILLFYYGKDKKNKLSIGAVLLDKKNPQNILWRTDLSLWREPEDKIFFPLGITKQKGVYTFYGKDKENVFFATILPPIFFAKEETRKIFKTHPSLERINTNPILFPNKKNKWESSAVFNPAAAYIDGRVHLIYRAIGETGISVLGYTSSDDGINFFRKSKNPVYIPSEKFEFRIDDKKNKSFSFPYMSGGGWGGCEDPRISIIEDKAYLTYVAFNGVCPPGVAITSIKVKDFLTKHWDWKTPRLISPPGEIHKNWVVFPEKINGKYAILHSISPFIMIEYLDSLDEEGIVIKSYHNSHSDDRRWDNIMRGVGAPPIRTEYGWLIFYHAMDRRDPNRYKVGAMILDYKNPKKILYRSLQPVLEPDADYENNGFKSGVVYVCGAIVKEEKIFVYYGGADKVVCVACASLKDFLQSLVKSPELVFLKKVIMI